MAILAGAVLPRLADSDRRQAELEVQAVESLLTAAAERDAFASEPIAISFDPATSTASRFGAPPGATGTLSFSVRRIPDPARPIPQWIADPLIPPVTLFLTEVREAAADGLRLAPRGWRLPFAQTEPRPSLSLLLVAHQASRNGGAPISAWQLDLAPEALSPIRTPITSSFTPHLAPLPSRSIDLDATGRGAQSW